MSACANAIIYALGYSNFKFDQDYKPIDHYIREEIETPATILKNPIARFIENYFYRQDAVSVRNDSQAKFLQYQIETTTTGAILPIT
ncbi:MAG: hypothetical protein EZS28_004519 [Streblomastix strix]|uniref:Uncharacterized protein n=1 Tax=Streblomastix strix TaxID=222440 RepID=A0A5J4WXY9_9EUKA|nr:MAG: hypothetical protein EZS28_004519 [Streblomastix strix]